MQVDFGGPTTFGLEIARTDDIYSPNSDQASPKGFSPNGSTFSLGDMTERGCFNHRWPFNEYYLDLHENFSTDGKNTRSHVGTCQMFSFAYPEEKTFYQILRIEEGSVSSADPNSNCKFPDESQVVLTMGGPVWFRSFKATDRLRAEG